MKKIFIFIIALTFLSCTENSYQESEWKIVYRNNADGKAIMGDKSELLDAARKGYPIRIGFGGRRAKDTLKSVEHIAEAKFLTIANGTELFGQIDAIYGQKPFLDSDTLKIELRNENMWTMLIGTNGERSTLSRQFDPSKIGQSKQSNRGATWYVKLPKNKSSERALPLWD